MFNNFKFGQFWRGMPSYQTLFPAEGFVRRLDVDGRAPCQLGMYTWHVIFGEDLRLPRRELDPRVFLQLKWINTEVEFVRVFAIIVNKFAIIATNLQ